MFTWYFIFKKCRFNVSSCRTRREFGTAIVFRSQQFKNDIEKDSLKNGRQKKIRENVVFALWKERVNPLIPDPHYSERQGKPLSLHIQQLEVDFKLNCGFLFFAPWELMG